MRGAGNCIGDAISNRAQPPSTATEAPPPQHNPIQPPPRIPIPSIHPNRAKSLPHPSTSEPGGSSPAPSPLYTIIHHVCDIVHSFIQSHASFIHMLQPAGEAFNWDENDSDVTVTGKNGQLFILLNPDASGNSKSDILFHLGTAGGGSRPEVDGCRCTTLVRSDDRHADGWRSPGGGGLLRRRSGWDWDWERERERWVRWMEVLGRLV